MKKRVLAIVLMVVMVMCMSMTAFAADGLSGDESTLLNHFISVLNKHADGIGANRISQYSAEAERALTVVNLDSNGCADLTKAVDDVDAYLTAQSAHTASDMKKALPEVLKIVNNTSTKYNMTVSVDLAKADKSAPATVTIKTPPAPGQDVPAQENQVVDIGGNIIRQTGVDYAVTAGVLGVFAIGLASAIGFVLVQKKKVNA